jgi:cell division protein FtsW (lipid II flippase)
LRLDDSVRAFPHAGDGTSDPIYAAAGLAPLPVLDSNLHFFAGAWFGLGVAILWLVPRIDTQTVLFRAIWFMIFCGGVGRLVSLMLVGRQVRIAK